MFVPLLLRLANDVEENPGPTVYDSVDPNKTISAGFSQGNIRTFKENAGKQCVAMCFSAVLHSQLKNINEWDSTFLNDILYSGNMLYSHVRNSVNKNFLLLSDIPKIISLCNTVYFVQYSDPFAGNLFTISNSLPYCSLEYAFNNPFSGPCSSYQYCLLTIDCNTVAIFRTSDQTFKIFDPHSRDLYGMPHPLGKCVLVSVESINMLVIYFQNTVPRGNSVPFEATGVTIQVQYSEIPQQNAFCFVQSTTPKEHKKCPDRPKSDEQVGNLEKDRIYRKRKRALENENEKQDRRKKQREYSRKTLKKKNKLRQLCMEILQNNCILNKV